MCVFDKNGNPVKKHFPANGDATLSGVIVDCNKETGLANKVDSYIFGGQLKET